MVLSGWHISLGERYKSPYVTSWAKKGKATADIPRRVTRRIFNTIGSAVCPLRDGNSTEPPYMFLLAKKEGDGDAKVQRRDSGQERP